MTNRLRADRAHVLTISVEDYFHASALEGTIRRKHWDRFESRLVRNVDEVLALLDRYDTKGTFFVLGCIADRQPALVRRIAERGHEVATSGYWPRGLTGMLPDEFREDLRRARAALEAAGSNRIVGYRSPQRWLTGDDLWVLDVLIEEGFVYDSSINPVLLRFAHDSRRQVVHAHRHSSGDGTITEFPISTIGLLGVRIAISGGNYFRQLPNGMVRRAITRWIRTRDAPLVFYFMPWELDRGQPQLTSISRLTRVRHYRNLAKTRWVLEQYLQQYKFQPVSGHLGRTWEPLPPSASLQASPASAVEVAQAASGTPVSLVVPLFNEEENIGYLQRTLAEFRQRLSGTYDLRFILVDDGSTDRTYESLQETFSGVTKCRLIRQPRNRGVAAAMLEGIRQADTEIVGTIDCDLSYDPAELIAMIPLLENADLVTASPYHPNGRVLNVPWWRLGLSRTLSRMYSFLLRERFYTYTSCCRVYRRSAMEGLAVTNGNFLGVAETLIRLKLKGGRIVEHPATLESRLFGESKMKIVKTIRAHGALLRELARRGRSRGL